MQLYRESILLELKEYSQVEYMIFKGAEITFPKEKEMLLTVKDSVFVREKGEELVGEFAKEARL